MEDGFVDQVRFTTLEDFIARSNNFHLHFLPESDVGRIYRTRPAFRRFQRMYPELERTVTQATMKTSQNGASHPYRLMIAAYNLMSRLVHKDDHHVRNTDGTFCSSYLLR